jgi:hypothetical protein
MQNVNEAVARSIDALGSKLGDLEALVRQAAPEVWGMEVAYQRSTSLVWGCFDVALAVIVLCALVRFVPTVIAEWRKDILEQCECLLVFGTILCVVLTGGLVVGVSGAMGRLVNYLNVEREALHALLGSLS